MKYFVASIIREIYIPSNYFEFILKKYIRNISSIGIHGILDKIKSIFQIIFQFQYEDKKLSQIMLQIMQLEIKLLYSLEIKLLLCNNLTMLHFYFYITFYFYIIFVSQMSFYSALFETLKIGRDQVTVVIE